MIELTFLGITVLAPASEKAPWIPCRERDGYLAVSYSYFSQKEICSKLVSQPSFPSCVFSSPSLSLPLNTTPRTPLTLPSLLSPLFSRLYSSPFSPVYLRSSQPVPFLLLSSGCNFPCCCFFCVVISPRCSQLSFSCSSRLVAIFPCCCFFVYLLLVLTSNAPSRSSSYRPL